jgi:pilus assembly protein CpaC
VSRTRQFVAISLLTAGMMWRIPAAGAQQQDAPPAPPQQQEAAPRQDAPPAPAPAAPAPQQQDAAPAPAAPAPQEAAPAQPPAPQDATPAPAPAAPQETAPAQAPPQETAPAQQPATPPVETAPAQPLAQAPQQDPAPAPPHAQEPPPAAAPAAEPAPPPPPPPQREQQPPTGGISGKWTVTVGKSLTIDSPLPIQRISVANGDLADAVAVNPKEILINGKQPGETTVIIWQQNGPRLMYELSVRPSALRLEAVRQQIARDFPNDEINITFDNDTAFVRGSVKDVTAADRVMAIASTLGRAINLLRVDVPPNETQILLKVRFANVNRSASTNLGLSLASSAFNQNVATGTGGPVSTDGGRSFSLSDAVNILFFRHDINLLAELKALETRNMLEMLAEPNVLAINGKEASFVAGGEFPFPMVQGGASVGTVTLMWREYGVRLHFLPTITPRGSIRLQVAPEVSSLDYTNAVTIQGFTVPGISTRRVQTEIELESGQSFVIAGLIDKQMTEAFSRIPGIGNIPLLGKLFQSKTVNRNNNELLVIVTPEVVKPIPAGQAVPDLNYPKKFMTDNTTTSLRHPGIDKTGNVTTKPAKETMPIEELIQQQKQGQPAPAPAMAPMQLVPMPVNPGNGSPNAGLAPSPAASAAPAAGGPVK